MAFVVTIRPDRDRTVVTAGTVHQARAHLAAHGLRKDGQYGGPGEACCVIGHVAAITRDLRVAFDAVDAAWHLWRRDLGLPWGGAVLWWNDHVATPEQVAEFYDSWAEWLEAGQ